MFEETLAVTKIKSDFKYFFRYAKKFSVCASDKLEMCAILLEQFNSVFTTPLLNKQVIDTAMFSIA